MAGAAHGDKGEDLSRALGSDPDFKVRVTAAVGVRQLRGPRGGAGPVSGLGDRNETVRGMSAAALGKIGDPAAVGALERVERDRSDFVRGNVREALLLLRPTEASAGMARAPERSAPARRIPGPRVALA